MAIIASGSKTIVDITDGRSLSIHIGSDRPKTQIKNSNDGSFSPDWSTTAGRLTLTPVVYAGSEQIMPSSSRLSVTWKRRVGGSSTESNLTTGETVSGNILTVSANKLDAATGHIITYVAHASYSDPNTGETVTATADIDFAMVTTGQNGQDGHDGTSAKLVWISGEQVFKIDAKGDITPSEIVLTATPQNVTISKWQFKKSSGVWADYPVGTITSSTLTVSPSHNIWSDKRATIRVLTSEQDVIDEFSVFQVSDGAAGGSATTLFLTNENITFAANASGSIETTTTTSNVVCYVGTTKTTPTVGTISGTQTGLTVTKGTAVNKEVPLTIKATGALGGSGPSSGTVSIPITAPISTTLNLTWSKVNTGATGAAGADGYVFSIYSPDGTVFNNGLVHEGESSQSSTITLRTQFYRGSTNIASSSTSYFTWERYVSGSWVTYKARASGNSGNTCPVLAADVQSSCAFRCTAEDTSAQVGNMVDTITIIDKTDNYQAGIDSTAGDIFKNAIGETCLICRLWQAGSEVDEQKSVVFSDTAPSNPQPGDFYYKITKSPSVQHGTKLMRFSELSSQWIDVTSDSPYSHTKTYKWYRRDKNGNPLDNGAIFATGKVIFINGDDVDVKTVFTCEVE